MRHSVTAGAACLALALAGCAPPETKLKAIIGATLIDGTGSPPISDAVIVTDGPRIRAAGPRSAVPVPAGSEKIKGAGKFVVPGLIDLAGMPAVNAHTDYGVTYARGALGPGLPHMTLAAEANTLLKSRPAALLGVISDTEHFDAGLVRRMAELGVVIIPQLGGVESKPETLRVAQRNTRRLAGESVRIAIASAAAPGVGFHREAALLAAAGLSPMEVILAATRNGALALGKQKELGTVEAGKRADLLLLSADPLADIRNLRRIERVMVSGEWMELHPVSR